MSETADPFDLQRFVDARAGDHAQALAELRAGRKQTHWLARLSEEQRSPRC